jgi:hypothetical protein
MGMYASVRGWLEADHRQRGAIEAVIEAARRDLYSGLFVISDEQAAVSAWEIRDGIVPDRPVPEAALRRAAHGGRDGGR